MLEILPVKISEGADYTIVKTICEMCGGSGKRIAGYDFIFKETIYNKCPNCNGRETVERLSMKY